ncbi:MAG: phosphoenolpyruvate carboxykinase (ATP), partial [Planctomycetota bacterium]
TSITQNTRGAYPIEFMRNARIPCVADHPTDIIFLTCDAFGVLPPVAKLTPDQAMYYFISGYTAKVAGTEMGVTEPEATFSPCFGGPFLVWHPGVYARLLAEKIRRHQSHVWLVNTGWSGGAYGTGSRMPLRFTRAVIDGIHSGNLRTAPTTHDPIMNLNIVTTCYGVPTEMLQPRLSWRDVNAFEETSRKLAARFRKNFEQYTSAVDPAVGQCGPTG